VISLAIGAKLDRALESGAGLFGSAKDENAAGFTIETERHAKNFVAQILSACADQAGPWAIPRAMTHDMGWLVDNEQVGSFEEHPAAEFFGGD
jgi:hypothetical protein